MMRFEKAETAILDILQTAYDENDDNCHMTIDEIKSCHPVLAALPAFDVNAAIEYLVSVGEIEYLPALTDVTKDSYRTYKGKDKACPALT